MDAEWIVFIAFLIGTTWFIWFICRICGFFNFKKYEQELRQLSDKELLERRKSIDTFAAHRDDVYMLLAVQLALIKKEIRRRRRCFHNGTLQKTYS